MTKTHQISWTDSEGHSYSVTADFITAVALYDALSTAAKAKSKNVATPRTISMSHKSK